MPVNITILGLPYTVELKECVAKGESLRGQIHFAEQRIVIDRTLPKEMQEVTLIHEILHAICDIQGIEELSDNEQAIQNLAIGLYSLSCRESIISS